MMSVNFLNHIDEIIDPRIPGMTTYPLQEVLLVVLVGLLCRVEDLEEMELLCQEQIEWFRRILPFKHGPAPAQTLRRVLRMLDPLALERAFSSWVKSLQVKLTGVVSIDGKTLRGSKQDQNGQGALHLVSAYAHASGMMLAQRAVDEKSNEITAIPELLKMLEIEGTVVTIDAMGTQKDIAARIIARKADYLLSLKGNQGTLHRDVTEFFADPALLEMCQCYTDTSSGHGRIEERTCHVMDVSSWLCARHPGWKHLRSIVQVNVTRTIKKSGKTSCEKRFYITSLLADPVHILNVCRSHWGIENNLHWQLDVTFREDECRVRKDHSARNLATMRRAALNLLKQDHTKIPIKTKRLMAMINPEFRISLLLVND